MRNLHQVNRRVDDGPKMRLLCADCEKIFNKWETYFANKVFNKMLNNNQMEIEYNENLWKFVYSVKWRLIKGIEKTELKWSTDKKSLLKQVEINFYNEIQDNSNKEDKNILINLHCLFGADLFKYDPQYSNLSHSIQYFGRATDFSINFEKEPYFIYLKLPRFIFVTYFMPVNANLFKNTSIKNGSGEYNANIGRIEDPDFVNFLIDTLQKVSVVMSSMSITQREKSKLSLLSKTKLNTDKDSDLVQILKYQKWKESNNGSS